MLTYADYYSGSMGSLYKPPLQGAQPVYGYFGAGGPANVRTQQAGYNYGSMGHGTLGPQYASAPQSGGEYMQVKDANGKVIGIRRRQQQAPPQYGMLPRPGMPQTPQYSNPAYYTTDV